MTNTAGISELFLQEVRELRASFNANAQETGERLSWLDTDMKAIVANDRKGRLESVEDDVKDMQR